MNEDIAQALIDFVSALTKAQDAILADPEKTATSLTALIGAIEAAVENFNQNEYEESDREVVRSLVDFAAAELATTVLVAGTVVLLAPSAGVVAVAVASFATSELLSDWLETNRFSFFPSVQDASSATHGVTLYGYAPWGDTLTSSMHDDRVFGFSGNDYIVNNGGSDAVFGGLGQDTLDYSAMAFASSGGIVLDASAGDGSFVVHHHSDTDVVTEVEHVIGTSVADAIMLGNYGANIAGGGHIETIDAGAGDDVALFLNEGGTGPRRVAVDGSSGLDTIVIADDAFNTEIDFNAGTVWYQGGVNAQFSIVGFEAARGGDGNDVMLGGDGSEYLLGNDGADRLFGGGGDDFIFFDAADGGNVNGGAGRDVGVALGPDAVAVDMLAQELEVCIGGGGADTITCAGSEAALFAAGGDGADTFNVTHDDAEAVKILWGGAGADTFDFSLSQPDNWYDQLGIAVVRMAGLTDEIFASLTLADLGLGGIDLSLIDAIILNPDAADRFIQHGVQIDATGMEDWYDPEEDGMDFLSQPSTYLGGSQVIQSFFLTELWSDPYQEPYVEDREYYRFEVTMTNGGLQTEVIANEGFDGLRWSAIQQAYVPVSSSDPEIIAQIPDVESNAADWFAENPPPQPELVHHASDVPIGRWFVVGGSFSGEDLVSDGALAASAPDPGTTPFDWLLAA